MKPSAPHVLAVRRASSAPQALIKIMGILRAPGSAATPAPSFRSHGRSKTAALGRRRTSKASTLSQTTAKHLLGQPVLDRQSRDSFEVADVCRYDGQLISAGNRRDTDV